MQRKATEEEIRAIERDLMQQEIRDMAARVTEHFEKITETFKSAAYAVTEEERIRIVSDPHLRRNLPVPPRPLGASKKATP